jgi:glycosyltransferase involved in cell wall biosynthesis
VDEDAKHVAAAARRVGVRTGPASWAPHATRQSVFLTSHFDALTPRWLGSSHALGTAYMHGRPGTAGYPEFDAAFDTLRSSRGRIARIQVTHAEMHELVVAAGVDSASVFRIPLGIDLEHFPFGGVDAKATARNEIGLPVSAFVLGSFQKDGVGWGEGIEPKLIKGPDVLLEVVSRLRTDIPELFVLVTGPARGFVRRGLEGLGVPYRHFAAHSRAALARAYHALDVYTVTSRQEGGPKAVLESLAAGVPLVTTRVGQVSEVAEGEDVALLADSEDVEALVSSVMRVYRDTQLRAALRDKGRRVAERFALERIDPLWLDLFEGFVATQPAEPAR